MKRHKYGAKSCVIDGHKFPSLSEGRRYSELKILERAGKIHSLELQPAFKFTIDGRPVLIRSDRYPNGRHAGYKADFRYWDNERRAIVVEDCKSKATRTEAYKIRRALVECMWPGTIIEEV